MSSISRAFTTKKPARPQISDPVPSRSLTTKKSFLSGSTQISDPITSRSLTTKKSFLSGSTQNSDPMPSRSLTTKKSFLSGSIRHKISAPVELLSTTNMLSYNAPDLHPKAASSSTSGDESDMPSISHSTSTTPNSSIRGSTPITPISPEPNHLSSYFDKPGSGRQSTSSSEDAPTVPQRALSHTKKTHEVLSQQRSKGHNSAHSDSYSGSYSASHSGSHSGSVHRMPSVKSFSRNSIDMFSANAETFDAHPFGSELAQVRELAEEYGKMHVVDAEEQELLSLGLCKFSADDYASEIRALFSSLMADAPRPAAVWI